VEAPGVEQLLNPLASGELAFFVLRLNASFTAT
jgi:hypothetical protein